MRECTLLPGQALVLADGLRLTVVSIQGDEVRFALTPEDAGVTLKRSDVREEAPKGHFAIPSMN